MDSDECHNDVICIVFHSLFSLSLFFCIVIRLVIFTGVYAFTIQTDIKPFAADNNENQTNSLERNHLNAHFSFHCAPHLAPVLLYTQEMRFKFYLMLAYSAKVKFSKLFRTMRGVAVAAIFLSTFFSSSSFRHKTKLRKLIHANEIG